MRLRKLGPAVLAATSLLALAPAAASAHKHPSPLGRCRINIKLHARHDLRRRVDRSLRVSSTAAAA